MNFYRYDNLTYEGGHVKVSLEIFHLVKETPCGWWIAPDPMLYSFFRKKWVSKTARKRYAYPTKQEALKSFLSRKYKHLEILRQRLEEVMAAWDMASAIYIKDYPEDKHFVERRQKSWIFDLTNHYRLHLRIYDN